MLLIVLWGLLGAGGAVTLEYLYRASGKTWFALLPIIIPVQIIVSRSIWNIVTRDSIIAVSIFFSFGTAVMRVGASWYAGDKLSSSSWLAYALVTLAVLVRITGAK